MSHQRSSSTSPQALRAALIESRAMSMRLQGHSYEAIAAELGVSQSLANRAVRRALARLRAETRESAKESKDIELARLDVLLLRAHVALTAAATVRSIKDATETILKIMDRRAKYLGLDAPTKVVQADLDVSRPPSLADLPLDALDRIQDVVEAFEREDTAEGDEVNLDEEVDYGSPEEAFSDGTPSDPPGA